MEKTGDNVKRCSELVDDFFVMQYLPHPDREKHARFALARTLLEACSSLKVAEALVEQVIANEERFPAPGTLRRHLRDELNCIEADVSERLDREIQASVEARNREWNEQRAKAALDE